MIFERKVAKRREIEMDHFIFSLNVTAPIFLVMVLGYALRQARILDENFDASGNAVSGYIAGSDPGNFRFALCVILRGGKHAVFLVDMGSVEAVFKGRVFARGICTGKLQKQRRGHGTCVY